MPACASDSAFQSDCRISSRPVAEAIEKSTWYFPKKRHQTYSLMEMNRAARQKRSEHSSFSQSNLHSGDMAWIGTPVCRYMRLPASLFLSLSALTSLRRSAHV